MEKKYGEFIGVDNLVYALLTKDDSTGYTAGTPKVLAPAAEVAAAATVNKLTTYYDNVASNTYVTEGETEIKAVVANIDAKAMAEILGKFFDVTTGRVIDAGSANPPACALGFRYNMGSSGYRYYWFLHGTFAGGEEAATTKKDDVDVKNYELTFTAVPTDYKFTVDGKLSQVKRVFGDTAEASFDPTGWFTQVQIPGAVAPSAIALSTIVPADGAASVARSSTIVLTFNNKIASESISLINTTSGDTVAFTKSWDTTGKILTLTPSSTMAATTKHVVAVNGVTDIYGQVLAASGKDFTTAA
jgi:phi13 family phage major tail protein